MPSISRAGRSFSILARAFKFSKFSILERNCITWIWSKQKLICEEWIYLHAYKSVIMQWVLVFITSQPYTVFFCFSTPAFCLERDYYMHSKCARKLWQGLYSCSYNLGTMGQILQCSSSCTVSQENNNFIPGQFNEGWLLSEKTTISLYAVIAYFC